MSENNLMENAPMNSDWGTKPNAEGAFVNMWDLKARDLWLKGGSDFDTESLNLTNIYLGRARDMTRQWLKGLGQGDAANLKPVQTKLLKRFVHTSAQIWKSPPIRRPVVEGVTMPDGDATASLISKVYQRARINSWLKQLDRWRTLVGQSVLYFSPPLPRREASVRPRIFAPHHVMRDPDDTAQDDISQDRRIAVEVYHNDRQPLQSIWHYYEQTDPDQWSAFRVYQSGELVDGDRDALYPDGIVPFLGCPFTVAYDELTEGHAWLQIDESRTAFALGMSVVMNDLLYLVKQEAHTSIGVTGITNQQDLPKRWGAGEFWGFEDPDVKITPIALSPKLQESILLSRHIQEVFCSGEGLPADYFLSTRKYDTGAAGRLRQQDLEDRRQDQAEAAIETELEIFETIRNITNCYADGPDDQIDPDYEMTVELGRQWFPMDLAELQTTAAFDLSIGSASIIDYLMERHRLSRERAIDFWERVQGDREKYPVRENPAALIIGRNNAGAPGSATAVPDASSMNADRSASNEKGSAIGAAQRALEIAG